jgi:hypothetical protein
MKRETETDVYFRNKLLFIESEFLFLEVMYSLRNVNVVILSDT